MPERINAAHRLDQILSEVVGKADMVAAAETWAEVFGVTASDPNRRAVEVAHMLGLLRDQVTEIRQGMSNTPVRPRRYEDALQEVLKALDVRSLNVPWQNHKQYLKIEVLHAVSWCADTLPVDEEIIDPAGYTNFRDDVKQFRDKIEVSELPDYVKKFVFKQITIMEQAIREYRVTGARAFRHGYVNSFINFSENQETFLKHQDEEEMQDLILFRFVDGIMGACQRYSTHR